MGGRARSRASGVQLRPVESKDFRDEHLVVVLNTPEVRVMAVTDPMVAIVFLDVYQLATVHFCRRFRKLKVLLWVKLHRTHTILYKTKG